jgi:hypothetical protein
MSRGRPRCNIELSAEERHELTRRVRADTAEQREARRARIVLCLADGLDVQATARAARSSTRTVERWRGRFVCSRLAGLVDRPGRGRKPTFGHVTRMQILSIACDPKSVAIVAPCRCHQLSEKQFFLRSTLEKLADAKTLSPIWQLLVAVMGAALVSVPSEQSKEVFIPRTIEEVAREAERRGVVKTISKSSVQRILSEGDLHPHKIRGWMHSPDPEFQQKVTEICELYQNPPPHSVVICVDEMTGIQAIERCNADRGAYPGGLGRREYEYIRNGTQVLLAGWNVQSGEVTAICKDQRAASDLLELMEEIARRYPDSRVHIVWDNLNTHVNGPEKRWDTFNARHQNRFVFHYTPIHASWVNQVELFFSIVRRRCLKHASFRSTFHLHLKVLEFIAQWNSRPHPFRWTFGGYPLQAGVEDRQAA